MVTDPDSRETRPRPPASSRLVLVAAVGLARLVLFFVVRAATLSARKKHVSEQ